MTRITTVLKKEITILIFIIKQELGKINNIMQYNPFSFHIRQTYTYTNIHRSYINIKYVYI